MNKINKNFVNGITASLVGRLISIILPIFIMKPMLNYLGEDTFGIWLLAVSITAIGYFFVSAINNSLLTRLSAITLEKDNSNIKIVIGQGILFNAIISSLLIIFILFLILLFNFYTNYNDNCIEKKYFIVIISSLISLILSSNLQIVGTVFNSEKRFLYYQIFQNCGSLVSVLSVFIAIHFDIGRINVIHLYNFTPLIIQSAFTLLYFCFYKKNRPVFQEFNALEFKNILNNSLDFLIVSIFIVISMNIDYLLLTFWEGPASVTEIGPPMRMGSALQLVVAALSMPLWSIYGEAVAMGKISSIRQAIWQFAFFISGITLLIGSGIVLFSNELMMLWMGRSFEDQGKVLSGTVALAVAMSITSPHNMLLNSQGRARQQVLPWALFLFGTLLLKNFALAFGESWWLPWVSAGCYILFITPIILVYSKRFFDGRLDKSIL